MTVAEALPRLYQVCVLGATHADYARTAELATLYRRLATGKDLEKEMRRMASRETPEQFDSRVGMTIMTVPASWNQGRTPFYETARLRGGTVTKRLDYAEEIPASEADRLRERLTQATNRYYSGKPIESYLAEQLTKSHCMSDPNAWLLTEFAPFNPNTQVAKPYPFLVPCEAAVDFSRAAGETQSFTGRFIVPQAPTRYRYVCYLENEAIDCWPVLWDEGKQGVSTMPEGSRVIEVFRELTTDGQPGKILYECRLLTHRAGRVPASVLGYVVDEEGSGESFVSPLHAGVAFLLQMLKVGSENDVVMSQMATPIRVGYVPECPGAGTDSQGLKHTCVNGLCPETLTRCTACSGTGTIPIPITALETYTLPMPKPGEEMRVKPADLLDFKGPATDNPKLQLNYLESRRQLFMQAVHGRVDIARSGAKTATEVEEQMQAKLTAQAPFADWFASAQVYHTMVCAGYTDTGQGLDAVYQMPANLKLISESDLYILRAAAKESGADASVLEGIDAQIAIKQNANDAAALQKSLVKRRFMTFLGQTNDWVTQQATLGYISPEHRVLHTHVDIIFGELEVEVPTFYQLAYSAQLQYVNTKVADILRKMPTAAATMPRLDLNPTVQAVAATA